MVNDIAVPLPTWMDIVPVRSSLLPTAISVPVEVVARFDPDASAPAVPEYPRICPVPASKFLLTVMFPEPPEVPEVRLSQVPDESPSTFAVMPAPDELIAVARSERVSAPLPV
jgi:hypothetical protein